MMAFFSSRLGHGSRGHARNRLPIPSLCLRPCRRTIRFGLRQGPLAPYPEPPLITQALRVTRAGEAFAATRAAKRARTAESVPERQDPKRRRLMISRADSLVTGSKVAARVLA